MNIIYTIVQEYIIALIINENNIPLYLLNNNKAYHFANT